MVILDTNIISETMRQNPVAEVLNWLDEQPANSLFISAITEAEIHFGIAVLPAGKRRERLAAAADRAFGTLFKGHVLPFDREAALAYAEIAASRRASGHPIS
ncbi:MAG TPA: PIN domain-containing protein [Gammaproteobacteria bacterium]|nr:PIN domain-containing protein [Gammaproteobacteria bacterium]